MAIARWQQRLKSLVSDMRRSERPVEYPFKRVFEIVDAPTSAALIEELTSLVGTGELKAVYRIRSKETGAGIGEYQKITEIPQTLYDETADREQRVELARDVELIYRTPA